MKVLCLPSLRRYPLISSGAFAPVFLNSFSDLLEYKDRGEGTKYKLKVKNKFH